MAREWCARPRPTPTPTLDARAGPPEGPAPRGLRVLVVEDDRLLAELVADMIHDMGHHVVGPCFRHEEAFVAAARPDVDVALLDLMVDGRDTRDVADALGRSGVPVVLSTGFGRTAGLPPCAAVLTKPYSDVELDAALRLCAPPPDARSTLPPVTPTATDAARAVGT